MLTLQNSKISIDNAGYYHTVYKHASIQRLHDIGKMHGPRRVVVFCCLTAVLPTVLIIIPLYLRHSVFADVYYNVAESDVFEIEEGMSSIFCQEHTLEMNTSFNAYQLSSLPEISTKRKHIRLKKSMSLPDDTLEYWGFYLLKGATVALKVCSRHEGSKILVVRGERNLRTCGLMNHNTNKPHYDKDHKQVKVTFETAAQEIVDSEEKIEFKIVQTKNKTEEQDQDRNTAAEEEDENISDLLANAEKFLSKRLPNNKTNEEEKHQAAAEKEENISDLLADAEKFLNKRLNKNNNKNEEQKSHHTKRHARKREREEKVSQLQKDLNDEFHSQTREKREVGHKLDGAIDHGGTAINYTYVPSGESNSVSSFEMNLLECYDGQILLTQSFPPSELCNDVHYLARSDHMQMVHEVSSDGYYYYIFYSDNDITSNDIHGVFDIYKPTFQYANMSDSDRCINSTQCNFAVSFFSDEVVIVEVPTRDGIEHEEDDITVLVSKCKPRMGVYIIFPIAILFLILGCAFL